jgi:anti-sigma factor RsiW
MALNAGGLGQASLFAAHAPRFGVIAPTVVERPEGHVAYWQVGRHVYALTAEAPRDQLAAAARQLSNTLH